MLRHVLRPGVFVNVCDVADGPAQSVQQRGAAPDTVIPVCHGPDRLQLRPVMDDLAAVVEEHSGHEALALRLLLLFDQAVEASDGVSLQAAHGAAAVQDEYQLGDVVFHNGKPPVL